MEDVILFTHSLSNKTQHIDATYNPHLKQLSAIDLPKEKKQIKIKKPDTESIKHEIILDNIGNEIKTQIQAILTAGNERLITDRFVKDKYKILKLPIDTSLRPKEIRENLYKYLSIDETLYKKSK